MATVFKPYVGDHVGQDGLVVWIMSGEEVLVDGVVAVRTSSKTISDDRSSWHETRQDAQAAAAEKILEVSARLSEQAAKVRSL